MLTTTSIITKPLSLSSFPLKLKLIPPLSLSRLYSPFRERKSQQKKSKKMCPLRIILIFLSATLAGFFVLRNLNSQPKLDVDTTTDTIADDSTPKTPVSGSVDRSSKVCSAIRTGFWTFVDMASGRYLWKNLVSSSKHVD